ncbi:MAG TPA: hypothetical protein VKA62_04000 [Agromyces sp.]|nr:hypothetical protein [Agromyces sp.]
MTGTDASARPSREAGPRSERGPLRRFLSPTASAFQTLFETVYLGLGIGMSAVVAGALPLLGAVVSIARPLEAWPFLLLCALPLGPAVAAAFAVFGAAKTATDVAPFRDYFRAWPSLALPALTVWASFIALAAVLIIDIGVIWGSPFAALIGPVTLVVGALAATGALHALAALAAGSGVGAFSAAKAGLIVAVRRPLLTLLSLVVVAVWAMVVLAQPALGLLALTGFALLVLQANSAAALAPLVAAEQGDKADENDEGAAPRLRG